MSNESIQKDADLMIMMMAVILTRAAATNTYWAFVVGQDLFQAFNT